MNTIDRMLTRQFIAAFLSLAVGVLALVMVIDLLSNVDEFMQAGEAAGPDLAARAAATLRALAGYYGPVLLLYFVMLWALFAAGAAVYVAASLVRTGELTALLAAGVSVRRVMFAPLLCTLGLAGGVLALQELALPRLMPALLRTQADVKRQGPRLSVDLAIDDTGNALIAAQFNPSTGVIGNLLYLRRDARGLIISELTAPEAAWSEADRAWLLRGAVEQVRGDFAARPSGFAGRLETSLDPRALTVAVSARARRLLSLQDLWSGREKSPRRVDELDGSFTAASVSPPPACSSPPSRSAWRCGATAATSPAGSPAPCSPRW